MEVRFNFCGKENVDESPPASSVKVCASFKYTDSVELSASNYLALSCGESSSWFAVTRARVIHCVLCFNATD